MRITRSAVFSFFILWLLAGSFAILGSHSTPLAQTSPPPRPGTPLPPPLDVLALSFRAGDPKHLRALLQGREKIHAFSPSLGLKPGYYSSDQIYFLFQDIFRSRTTRKFSFVRGTDIPPDARRLIAVARWTFRKGDSRDQEAEIAFDLVRLDGAWCIQEIREIL